MIMNTIVKPAQVWLLVGLLGFLGYITLTKKGRELALEIGQEIMKFSDNGLNVIKRFEGFSAVPYRDAQGWSIGYGHFILPGENLTQIDKAQAEVLLRKDAAIAEAAVDTHVTVPLTQNQFDALVSFVYNIGVSAFTKSTLLRKLNSGDYAAAAAQFAVWNKITDATTGQKVVKLALVTRRQGEQALFMSA